MTANRCDWGQCEREPVAGAFCDFHAAEYEREQQARNDEWWA